MPRPGTPSAIILILLALLTLNACQTLDSRSRQTRFNDTFQAYSKHLRWGHFREVTAFMTATHAQTELARLDSYKNVRVSQVQPMDWVALEDGNRLKGVVVIDYYRTSSAVIHQAQQEQSWVYANNQWRLDSGLPTLK